MGNTPSLQNLSSAAVADLLVKENAAYQIFAEKLFHGDGFLSLVDGNYLLSLDFDKPKDAEAFESIMEALEVSPRFLHKSLENLLRMMQQRSLLANHACWTQQQPEEEEEEQQQPSTTTLQDPSTSTPDDAPPPSSLGAAARRYSDVAASAAKKPEPPTTAPSAPLNTSLGIAARRYSDVAATKSPKEAKTNQVQLWWSPKGSTSCVRIGPVTLVDPTPQTERLWKDLTEIVLKDFTTEPWARNINTNATIQAAADDSGIADLIRVLGGNRESAVGRFLVGSSSDASDSGPMEAPTGVMVISYLQSMKNKRGCLECRLETDIRRIKDCPLGPLPWQSPMSKLTKALSVNSPTFRPAMSPASVSAGASSTKPWTPVRNKDRATPASRTSMSWRTPVRNKEYSVKATPASASSSSSMSTTGTNKSTETSSSSSTTSWTPVRNKIRSTESTSAASPTTVMHFPDSALVEEPRMIKFRHRLENALKETFLGQRDFLEVADLWNEHEGSFGELSKEWKGAFICVVQQAIVAFNTETNNDLVFRKASKGINKLKRVTIFKDEAVAKRFALQTFGKTKVCAYWAKGNCLKGDECTYAHGEHDLAREFEPSLGFRLSEQQSNVTLDEESEKKEAIALQGPKASEKAVPVGALKADVVSGLVATTKTAHDTTTLVVEKVPPEIVQDQVEKEFAMAAGTVESADVAEIADTVAASESTKTASVASVCKEPEENCKVSDGAKTVSVAPEDEFDLALESAMAEALEALGVPEEASVRLEATEQQAEEDTSLQQSEPDESIERETTVSVVESSAERKEDSLDTNSVEFQEFTSTVAYAKHAGSIGRWGDVESSSDSDGP